LSDINQLLLDARDEIFEQFESISTSVVFTEKDVSGFDFSSGQVDSTSSSITVTGIVLRTIDIEKTNVPSYTVRVLCKSEEVTPSFYNTATFDGGIWNITKYFDNGYVTRFDVVEDR